MSMGTNLAARNSLKPKTKPHKLARQSRPAAPIVEGNRLPFSVPQEAPRPPVGRPEAAPPTLDPQVEALMHRASIEKLMESDTVQDAITKVNIKDYYNGRPVGGPQRAPQVMSIVKGEAAKTQEKTPEP